MKNDNVNHPKHYTSGSIECIDYIDDCLTKEEFRGYIKGNVIKYITRERHKNGNEDLRKAKWYLDKLVDTLDGLRDKFDVPELVKKEMHIPDQKSGDGQVYDTLDKHPSDNNTPCTHYTDNGNCMCGNTVYEPGVCFFHTDNKWKDCEHYSEKAFIKNQNDRKWTVQCKYYSNDIGCSIPFLACPYSKSKGYVDMTEKTKCTSFAIDDKYHCDYLER